jgi:hypothetical protein
VAPEVAGHDARWRHAAKRLDRLAQHRDGVSALELLPARRSGLRPTLPVVYVLDGEARSQTTVDAVDAVERIGATIGLLPAAIADSVAFALGR